MSNEEKTRVSGDQPRTESNGPILPTTMADVEKAAQPASAGIHPVFYVM